MKFFIVLAALVAIASAAGLGTPESEAQTIILNVDAAPEGPYKVE